MEFETLIIQNIGFVGILKILLILGIGILLGVLLKLFIGKLAKSLIYPGVRRNSPKSYKRVVSGVNLSSQAVLWFVILIFLFQALSVLNISFFDEIIISLARFLPKLGIAAIVFAVGFLISGILSRGIENSNFIGHHAIAKAFNVIFVTATALSALEIINIRLTPFLYLFLIGLFAIALGVAITVGIAFGLALQPEVTKIINSFKKK
jgi:hypothetical protein